MSLNIAHGAFPHAFVPTPMAAERWGRPVWVTLVSIAGLALFVGAVVDRWLPPAEPSAVVRACQWVTVAGLAAAALVASGVEVLARGWAVRQRRDPVSQWVRAIRAAGCSKATLAQALADTAEGYPKGWAIVRALQEIAPASHPSTPDQSHPLPRAATRPDISLSE